MRRNGTKRIVIWLFLTLVTAYSLRLLMCQYNKYSKKVGWSRIAYEANLWFLWSLDFISVWSRGPGWLWSHRWYGWGWGKNIVITSAELVNIHAVLDLYIASVWDHFEPIIQTKSDLTIVKGWAAVSNDVRELKQTTKATATGTSQNKRLNEQNYSCARVL